MQLEDPYEVAINDRVRRREYLRWGRVVWPIVHPEPNAFLCAIQGSHRLRALDTSQIGSNIVGRPMEGSDKSPGTQKGIFRLGQGSVAHTMARTECVSEHDTAIKRARRVGPRQKTI